MAWRVARSLETLRAEVNTLAPKRGKISDGLIGDAVHATRNSDHNPYIVVDGVGVVRAFDITHDPTGGCDAHAIADRIRLMGAEGDRRVRYVISNRRIASASSGWQWVVYTGVNPHSQHAHVSVVEDAAQFDRTDRWGIAPTTPGEEDDMQLTDRIDVTGLDGKKGTVTVGEALGAAWALSQRIPVTGADGGTGTVSVAEALGAAWELRQQQSKPT